MPKPEKFEVRIPSDTTIAQEVQERIVGHMERLSYTARDIFSVRLSLEEAITNAIRHGNGNDPKRHVLIECEVDPQRLLVRIQDEGNGFDPSTIPDPTDDDHLELTGGRGLLLMHTYMSSVKYNEDGNVVTLIRNRSPDESE